MEEGKRRVAAVKIDEGCDAEDISKEWLEDVITGNIRPIIDGLVIHPVALDKRHPGRVAYVVEVPQHYGAPIGDRRYYRRRNFKSEPMDDYEVREGMSRGRTGSVSFEI